MDAGRRFEEMKRRMLSHPTLMDDVPFTVAIRHSMALAELIIRTVLSQDDLVVTDVRCQEKVPGIGHRGVVFDALCFDSCGNMYDVEVQKGRFDDLPRRAAYYEAMLTVHSLEAGDRDYGRMPTRAVIFICDGDVVGRGWPVYDHRWRMEDGTGLGDGGRIVFVNGEYRGGDAIGRLMADMNQSAPGRAFNEEVRSTLGVLSGEEGARDMSDEMERLYNMVYNEAKTVGKVEGKAEGKAELAARMLKDGRYSLEEILDMTGLNADQVSEAARKYTAG